MIYAVLLLIATVVCIFGINFWHHRRQKRGGASHGGLTRQLILPSLLFGAGVSIANVIQSHSSGSLLTGLVAIVIVLPGNIAIGLPVSALVARRCKTILSLVAGIATGGAVGGLFYGAVVAVVVSVAIASLAPPPIVVVIGSAIGALGGVCSAVCWLVFNGGAALRKLHGPHAVPNTPSQTARRNAR